MSDRELLLNLGKEFTAFKEVAQKMTAQLEGQILALEKENGTLKERWPNTRTPGTVGTVMLSDIPVSSKSLIDKVRSAKTETDANLVLNTSFVKNGQAQV